MRRTWLILAAAVAIAAILGSVGVASAQEGTTTKASTVQGPGTLANGGLRLTDVVPRGGATGVPKDQTVRATFNKPLDPATVNNDTFKLKDKDNNNALVPATVSVSSSDPDLAKLDPTTNLTHNHHYKAVIEGGATGVQSTTGDQLSSVNTSQGIHFDGTQAYWSFTVK